jgi:DNA-binding CsgD family transcriptional regulator
MARSELDDGMPQRTFVSVLEGVDVPSWIIDDRGTFIWLNDAYIERFGDHRGDHIWSTVSPTCADDVERRLTQLLTGRNNVGAAVHFEVETMAPDGRPVRSEISAVRLQPGRFRGAIFGVLMTKRRRKNPVPSHLTRRQLEVLQLLVAGRSTEQIAAELVLSPETIRNHVRAILRAFHAHSRVEAVVEAWRQGFIQ